VRGDEEVRMKRKELAERANGLFGRIDEVKKVVVEKTPPGE